MARPIEEATSERMTGEWFVVYLIPYTDAKGPHLYVGQCEVSRFITGKRLAEHDKTRFGPNRQRTGAPRAVVVIGPPGSRGLQVDGTAAVARVLLPNRKAAIGAERFVKRQRKSAKLTAYTCCARTPDEVLEYLKVKE
jgi:hypothetical protein